MRRECALVSMRKEWRVGEGSGGGRVWSWTELGFGDSEDVFCRRDGDKTPGGRLYS